MGKLKQMFTKVKNVAKKAVAGVKAVPVKVAEAVGTKKDAITFSELVKLIKSNPSKWKESFSKYEISDVSNDQSNRGHVISILEVLNKDDRFAFLNKLSKLGVLNSFIVRNPDFDAVVDYSNRYRNIRTSDELLNPLSQLSPSGTTESIFAAMKDIASIPAEGELGGFEYILLMLPDNKRLDFVKLLPKETILHFINNTQLFVAVLNMLPKKDKIDLMSLLKITALLPIIKNVYDLLEFLATQTDDGQAKFMKSLDIKAFITIIPDAERLSKLFEKLSDKVKDAFIQRPEYLNIVLPSIAVAKFKAEIKLYQDKLSKRKDSSAKNNRQAKLQELMDMLSIQQSDMTNPAKYKEVLENFYAAFNTPEVKKIFSDTLMIKSLRKIANGLSFGLHKEQLTPYKKVFYRNVKSTLDNPQAFFNRYGLQFTAPAAAATSAKLAAK
jgi:hypothetical protein